MGGVVPESEGGEGEGGDGGGHSIPPSGAAGGGGEGRADGRPGSSNDLFGAVPSAQVVGGGEGGGGPAIEPPGLDMQWFEEWADGVTAAAAAATPPPTPTTLPADPTPWILPAPAPQPSPPDRPMLPPPPGEYIDGPVIYIFTGAGWLLPYSTDVTSRDRDGYERERSRRELLGLQPIAHEIYCDCDYCVTWRPGLWVGIPPPRRRTWFP